MTTAHVATIADLLGDRCKNVFENWPIYNYDHIHYRLYVFYYCIVGRFGGKFGKIIDQPEDY